MADEPKTYTEEEVQQLIEKEVAGLKTNSAELLREAKAAKKALAAYDGVDADEYKRLKDAAAEAERKRAAAEGDFSALQKQMAEKHQKELADRDAKIAKRDRAVERRLVQAQLQGALDRAGAKASFKDLLVLDGARSVRVRETEDDFEEYVVDERGNPVVADGNGSPMTLDQFVEQTLKARYPDAFNGTGSSGGGAARSAAGSGGQQVIAASDMAGFMRNVDKIADGEVHVR